MKIILASNSPRRREILENYGYEVEAVKSAPELPPPCIMTPEQEAAYRALEKGLDIAKEYFDTPVVSADTIVVVDGEVLGKPKDGEDAIKMLEKLSGRSHKVITAYTIFYKGRKFSNSVNTEVVFYPLEENEIKDYVATGEPFDKAGAYGIQGKGAYFVKEIHGDYLNVVGFPLSDFCHCLETLL